VVPDPYRWLEDQESPETRAWIDEQNEYTDAVFAQLPGRQQLTELATALLEVDQMGTPNEEGGRYFYSARKADEDLSVLYYRDGYAGEDHVVLDPHGMSEDLTTSVGYRDISKDGKLMLYAIREGGVDETSMRIKNIDTGEDLPDVFPTARYGSAQFTPDATAMYYGIFGGDDPRIYYHVLGTDLADDPEIYGEGLGMKDIPFAQLSDDGKWMIMTVVDGSSGPTSLSLAEVGADGMPGEFLEMINDGVSHNSASWAGDRILLTTDRDAPNSRVMLVDPANPGMDDWVEFIPERDDVVIQGASGVGGYYFVRYLKDVRPSVAQYQPDGTLVRELDFGAIGSVYGPSGEWDKKEGFVTFTSFHVPSTSYRIDVDTGEREVWFQNEIPIDTNAMDVRQVWYTSKDGTRIPMFIIHQKGLELNGDNPTYLTGYGGFNVNRTPGFNPATAAWVDMGGVYAIPNLRGGGEFGEEWHEAGMLGNKQNVFDDFIAAAEYLIAEGYTRKERLAIAGGSNGGLLVGAAMTQRPDLFGAVVCTYPLLDMVRYHKFMVASFWVPEYGSSEDPEQFEYIKAYSPYHNVVEGTSYPATLFITGDGDTRVAPLHARKMAALVQAANGGEDPILLRYHTKAGHSGGMPKSQQIEQLVDTWSFLRWQVAGDQAAGETGAE
jgi:prolyl oligopeptidase